MAFLSTLTHQSRKLYRKVFPIPCLLCGLPADQYPLCPHCIDELPRLGPSCPRCAMPMHTAQICGHCLQQPPVFDQSFSLYRYQDGVKRCIVSFKFHRQLQFAPFFAMQMYQALYRRDALPDCLIPVPLHPLRLRQRGFNQAAELARRLAKALNLDCRPDMLQRIRHTRAQSQLSLIQRRRNMRRAFHCPVTQLPAHVALVDDVMTTGITTAEAASVLRQKGAQHIEVWTIARAISHY